MADRMTPEQRHYCMSRIGSRDTRPELVVRRWLWHQGYRYRLCVRSLPGSPDIVMRKFRTVIFVNGCFWHGHACNSRRPQTHAQFWNDKIERNRRRDERNHAMLRAAGWHVLVVWECQLDVKHRRQTLRALDLELSRIVLEASRPAPRSYPDIDTGEPAVAAEP